jgi:chromosome partitioning protein
VVGVDRPVLEKEIPQISSAFDVILIDGAAKLQEMTASSLKIVDAILIPVQTSLADIWSALDLVDIVKARQQVTMGIPKAAFIVSRQTQNSRLAGDIDQALQQHELPIFRSRTSNRVVYMETLSAGTTVIDQEPQGVAAQEILEIRDELMAFLGLAR